MAKKKIEAPVITALEQAHQWTYDGKEVLILKCVNADGTSYGGFSWPLKARRKVQPKKWTATATCGDGLHGWAWGFGLGDGKDPDWSGKWIVFGAKPVDVIGNLEGGTKCKARAGVVRFAGDWNAAMQFILAGQMALVAHITKQATDNHTAGPNSASSATGYRSASSATGPNSASSATGYRSASSATGDRSAAVVTGLYGKARAGMYGCIALAWWNAKESRAEMRCAVTGCGDGSDGKLKTETWYRLSDSGEFEEVA